ncbi:MAG: glycosyltransferase [Phycisphaerae bacterium]|jgi:glycosyltransferase involved in cell wall biosynthesis
MLQNETITESQSEAGTIRPLIISDINTIRQYCSSVRHLLFGFEAQGIISAIVVPPASDIESFLFPGVGVVEHPALRFPLFFMQNRRRLIERIEKIKPDIIHCYGTSKVLLAKWLAEHFDIPAVITINSCHIGFPAKMIIKKGFERIIVPSGRVAGRLEQSGLPREKISQVNIGTFADERCVCFSKPERLPSMIVLGPFDKFSDYEPLLGAIRHLSVDGYEFVVIFMGQGRAEGRIRAFVKSTGLVQTVSITPLIRPLRAVFRGCDIFIHSCRLSEFDPAVIEAAGAGLAIAADKNNVEEFLQDSSAAVLFDGSDELSIYSSLGKLLDDRALAQSTASAAQNYLRSNNSVSSMINDLLKIYSEAKSS